MPRCTRCGATTEIERFPAIEVRCRSCERTHRVTLETGGRPRAPKLGLKALLLKKGHWQEAFLQRQARGEMVVDACPHCEGPLVARQDTPLPFDCAHCGRHEEVRLSEHVVDAMPSASITTSSWGGLIRLEWEPEHLEAALNEPFRCPSCGGPIPPFEGEARCQHCRAAFYALTACGRRFLPGVWVRGEEEGKKVDGWLPLTEAISHYAARVELAKAVSRLTFRSSLLWLGTMAATVLFGCGAFGVVALVAKYKGDVVRTAIGLFVALLLFPPGAFFFIWGSHYVKWSRKRKELLGGRQFLPRLITRR
jgi:hypothetical protein